MHPSPTALALNGVKHSGLGVWGRPECFGNEVHRLSPPYLPVNPFHNLKIIS